MIYKKEEDFAKAFKAEESPQNLYLLYGSEEYLVDAWKKKITARFDGDSFNFQKLDGRALDCDALYDAVESLPLMAAEKCVLVEDLDLSKLGGDGDKLENILRDLNPQCVLVITGKSAFDPKSAAAKKIIKLGDAAGAVVELGSRGQGGLTTFLKNTAKRRGCELSTQGARRILEVCENDMNTLTNEMEKICAYAGGGEITEAHITAVVTPKTEARVFDLSKAILAGNTRRAMEILGDLFYLREQPIAILSVLIMSYVDLYRARVARDSGAGQAEVVEKFSYKGREFRVRNAFSGRLSAVQLRGCLEALYQCDRKMKSTGVDGKILLEQTVAKLFLLGAA